MADPVPNAGAAAGAAAAPAETWEKKLGGIARSIAMFMAMQYAMKYGMQYMGIGPKPSEAPAAGVDVTTGASAEVPSAGITGASAAGAASSAKPAGPLYAEPIWPTGTPLSMWVYVNTAPTWQEIDPSAPTLSWDDLTLGDWKDVREADLLLDVPASVQNNGSWYMDVFLVKDGGEIVGRSPAEIAHHRKELTRWMPKRRIRKEKSLLGGNDEEEQVEEELEPEVDPKAKVVQSYWSNNITLTIVGDSAKIDTRALHPMTSQFYHLGPKTADDKLTYYPPIFPNDFWLLKENMMPINTTTPKLPLHVSYHAISSMKFQIMASLSASFDQAAQQQGTSAEFDEIKRMLTETNPILLITTAIVSILHMVFEFLAFSSDVKHWRQKDKDGNLVGVSVRTIITNCVVQLIILLYLHDSSEETSWMILGSQAIGLVIEAWKITKVVNIKVVEDPTSLLGRKITFEDKHELTEDEKKTQEYDRLAFRLVSYVAGPVLLAYSLYSLKYSTHRSWYSFAISTAAQAIYMFGFVNLVPQLIINYKLKSVAHMPMKAMVYKTLSTVVDDFFAFCIKMPWLHRLACFRDDVVFVILLIQMYIYRVDYSRTNEYGQVADDETKAKVKADEEEKAKEGDKLESKKDK